MHLTNDPRPLSRLTGEQLLLLAITGGNRRLIDQELSIRALLGQGSPRRGATPSRPQLRLVNGRAA